MAPFPTSKRQKIKERNLAWEQVLAGTVDIDGLRTLSRGGIPDHPPALRTRAWRLLLGLVSSDGGPDETARKRDEYAGLREMVVQRAVQQPRVNPRSSLSSDDQRLGQIDADVRRTQAMISFFSHPIPGAEPSQLEQRLDDLNPDRKSSRVEQRLSTTSTTVSSPVLSPTSTASTAATTLEIVTDFPKLHVTEPSPLSPIGSGSEIYGTPLGSSPPSLHSPPRHDRQERPFTYRDALTRLLFVYASLNPGVGFIQGMADLAAVVLFVFRQEADAEADAFWAFQSLMSHVHDVFVRALDGAIIDPASPASWSSIGRRRSSDDAPAQTGIGSLLRRYSDTLRWLDPKLATHLRVEGIEPHFYAFRWITCLFAQEFSLPDVIRLWDTFLSLASDPDEAALDFVTDFSCVLVLCQRDRLMSTGFAGCLGALQRVGHELPLDPASSSGGIDALCARALDIRRRRAFEATPKSSPVKPSADREIWIGEAPEDDVEDEGQEAPAEEGLFERYRKAVKSTTEAWKETDAAALLSKKATNWSIAASDWTSQAPATLAKLQKPIVIASARSSSERPPSPPDAPFSPPVTMERADSASSATPSADSSRGPKPLLLSASAKPASESPLSSRRTSLLVDTPRSNPSPRVASVDRPIPVLGRARSPSISPAEPRRLGLGRAPASRAPRGPRRHLSQDSVEAPSPPMIPRRGWTLTDAPASPPSPEEAIPVTTNGGWKLSHSRDVSEASAHAADYEPTSPSVPQIPVPPVPERKARTTSLNSTADLARLDGVKPKKLTKPPPTRQASGDVKGIRKFMKRRVSSQSSIESHRSWTEDDILATYSPSA